MANLLQIGLRSYQRYESGESIPPLHMLFSLAKILKVQPEDFIIDRKPLNSDVITIFEGDKKKIFEEDTLVKESNLVKILNSEEYLKSLELTDLTLMRKNSLFNSAHYSLFFANSKYCLLNPFAKKLMGLKSDYVLVSKVPESMKLQVEHLAYLIGKRKCYVQSILYPKTATGSYRLTCKYFFVGHKNNFYSLGVCEKD